MFLEFDFNQVITNILLYFPRLGSAILIFLAFWIGSRIAKRVLARFCEQRRLAPDATNLLVQVAETTLILFGSVTALDTMGVDVGALIAGLGLAGFAIGFAFKDLLSNFMAGFLILLYHPFVRGDKISVSGNEGVVMEINLRYTILNSEGKKVLIPNSTLFTNVVIVEKKVPATMI